MDPDDAEPVDDPSPALPTGSEKRNYFYIAVAYLAIALGTLGIFLPLLPTTPFLLLAAWSAAKGSPPLHRWLYAHPHFGGALIAWERNRAVSVQAKWFACILLTVSWLVMLYQTTGWAIPALTGILFVAGASFLLTRPSQ
jgi:uncharacterized membrane protein YbaN (DUF454 family)